MLKQDNKNKEMSECTFKPQTYSRQNYRRNLNEFLEDQKKHEEDKAMKINMRLEEESRQEGREIHQPQVCAKSEQMLQNKRLGPVHERLYDISKERMEKGVRKMWDTPDVAEIDLLGKGDVTQAEATFAPKINKRSEQMIRDRKVQDLLYEDAIKRQDAQQTRQAQADLESKSQMHHNTSHTNIEYLVHKFNREFEPYYESIANVDQAEGEYDDE